MPILVGLLMLCTHASVAQVSAPARARAAAATLYRDAYLANHSLKESNAALSRRAMTLAQRWTGTSAVDSAMRWNLQTLAGLLEQRLPSDEDWRRKSPEEIRSEVRAKAKECKRRATLAGDIDSTFPADSSLVSEMSVLVFCRLQSTIMAVATLQDMSNSPNAPRESIWWARFNFLFVHFTGIPESKDSAGAPPPPRITDTLILIRHVYDTVRVGPDTPRLPSDSVKVPSEALKGPRDTIIGVIIVPDSSHKPIGILPCVASVCREPPSVGLGQDTPRYGIVAAMPRIARETAIGGWVRVTSHVIASVLLHSGDPSRTGWEFAGGGQIGRITPLVGLLLWSDGRPEYGGGALYDVGGVAVGPSYFSRQRFGARIQVPLH